MHKKYMYMLFIFLFFIISTYICSIKYENEQNAKYVYNSDDLKCKYSVSNMKEKNEKYEILVYYPVTEYDDLNKEIIECINNNKTKFKENLAQSNNKLNVTFDTYEKDIYTSFVINIVIENGTSHKYTYAYCYNINNQNGQIYTIDDFIKQGNNTKDLSEYIYSNLKENKKIEESCNYEKIKDYLNEDKEKYNNFYFGKEGIVFCFNPDTIVPKVIGVTHCLIPYDKIKSS